MSLSKFIAHEVAIEHPHDVVPVNQRTVLMALGRISAAGPELNLIMLHGVMVPGEKLRVINLLLNPFTPVARELGMVHVGDSWVPENDLVPFFPLAFGTCPSLLLPSAWINTESRQKLYAKILKRYRDGVMLLKRAEKPLCDPVKLLEKQLNLDAVVDGDVIKPLTEPQSYALADTLLNPDVLRTEIQAFMLGWQLFTDSSYAGSMPEVVLTVNDVANYFQTFEASCHIPDM